MRHFVTSELSQIGLEPYAVYGGKVYSFKTKGGTVIPHGSEAYAQALSAHAEALRQSDIHDRRMGRFTP
jgi:hypothetical protein